MSDRLMFGHCGNCHQSLHYLQNEEFLRMSQDTWKVQKDMEHLGTFPDMCSKECLQLYLQTLEFAFIYDRVTL